MMIIPLIRNRITSAIAAVLVGLATLSSPLAAEPRHGGTLRLVVNFEPTSLVALATTAGTDYLLSSKITEGLLAYDREMNPVPQLATTWETSADGKSITFGLRKGVRWHDGNSFTSADVAFSIELLKEVHPRGRSTFANVTQIDTPDDSTVVIHLSQPAPYILNALAGAETPIIPKHIYEGTDARTNPHNAKPIGTGPFKFKEWVRGSHIIYECWFSRGTEPVFPPRSEPPLSMVM